jgi:UDP-N-acetylglucosamine 3-dehydrogenase
MTEPWQEDEEYEYRDNRIKVGIIGAGVMGRNHARVYKQHPDVNLIGCYDINIEASKSLGVKQDTAAYPHLEELLEYVDAVSICTPPETHVKIAKVCANAKKDILLEKPIARYITDADRIRVACLDNNVSLLVGHIERYNPVVSALRQICYEYSATKDRVLSINIKRVGPFPSRINTGILFDLGVHDFDIVRYLTNSPITKLNAVVSKVRNDFEDCAFIQMKTENDIIVNIEENWLTPILALQIAFDCLEVSKLPHIRNYMMVVMSMW